MNKKLTNFRESNRHPSQNDLPPIDKFHPDWWYYRQEMDEPDDEIDNIYKNESRNMNKKLIRLTESDLHKIVKESVKRVLKESAFNEYEVSFVFFVTSATIDKLLSKLNSIPNIQVQDVYEDDDEEWNVECVARVSCKTIEEVDLKMHKLLDRVGLTSWDYHYIKGLDNHEYWQP